MDLIACVRALICGRGGFRAGLVAVSRSVSGRLLAAFATAGLLAASPGHGQEGPLLSVSDSSASEGSTVDLTMTLSGTPGVPVQVDYRVRTGWTAGASAASADIGTVRLQGSLVDARSGTVRFGVDDAQKVLQIELVDDAMDEAHETVRVEFSRPRGLRLLRSSVVVTIEDNDDPPSVDFSSVHPDGEVREGQAAEFRVELSEPSGHDVFVSVQTLSGEDSGAHAVYSAGSGDYVTPGGRFRIRSGRRGRIFRVRTKQDNEWEFNEKLRVQFRRPRNAVLANPDAHGRHVFVTTIVEDPPPDAARPGRFVATARSPRRVQLAWELPEPGPGKEPKDDAMPQYYQIERSADGRATWQGLASRTRTSPYYVDVTAEPGTGYVYRVRGGREAPPVIESQWRESAAVTTPAMVEEDGGSIAIGGLTSSLDTLATRKRFRIELQGGVAYRVQVDGRAPYYLTTLTGPGGDTTSMRSQQMHFTAPQSATYTVTVERSEVSQAAIQLMGSLQIGCGNMPLSTCLDSGTSEDLVNENDVPMGFNEGGLVTGEFSLVIVPVADEGWATIDEGTHRYSFGRIQDRDQLTVRPQRGFAYAVRLRGREDGAVMHGGAYTPQVSQATRPSGAGYRVAHHLARPASSPHVVLIRYREQRGNAAYVEVVEHQGFLIDLRGKSGTEREEWRVWLAPTERQIGPDGESVGWADRIGPYTVEYRQVGEQVRGSGPVRAELGALPERHDGEQPFEAWVRFSEPVEASDEQIARELVKVRGGAVTGVERAFGRDDVWQLDIQPQGGADVTVSVEGEGTCANAAVCTDDGRPVAGTVRASVRGPGNGPEPESQGLVARWVRPPVEHDGQRVVVLRVAFGSPVETSANAFGAHAVSVTKGTVRDVFAVEGRADLWDVHVKPRSGADLTVRIGNAIACGATGALCTAGGDRLERPLSLVLPGPAKVRVGSPRVREAPGATLDFALSLDRSTRIPVRVAYRSRDRTAKAGQDYRAVMGSLVFAPGETAKTVSVKVLDDAIDEGEETMRLALWQPRANKVRRVVGIGTIVNSDPIPKQWIAHFGRTAAEHAVDAVGARLGSRDRPAGISLGGHSLALGANALRDPALDDAGPVRELDAGEALRTLTERELLLGSSFRLAGASAPGAPGWGAWGEIRAGGFRGERDRVRVDGDVTTAVVGADVGTDRWTGGVAVGASGGEGGFGTVGASDDQAGASGEVESRLVAVYPYGSVAVGERSRLWAIAGYGTGRLKLRHAAIDAIGVSEIEDPEFVPEDEFGEDGFGDDFGDGFGDDESPTVFGPWIETDLTMRMGAIGGRSELAGLKRFPGLALAVKGDAMWVRTASEAVRSQVQGNLAAATADTSRVRLALEASRAFDLGTGAVLTPRGEIGLRHDAGDAQVGTGVEAGAGVGYRRGRFTLDGTVRTLLAHEDSTYRAWSASGSMGLAPRPGTGRGLSFQLRPSWGPSGGLSRRVWGVGSPGALVAREGEGRAAVARLDGRVQIAWPLAGTRILVGPYLGTRLAGDGAHQAGAGLRLRAGEAAAVEIGGARESGRPAASWTLRVRLRW